MKALKEAVQEVVNQIYQQSGEISPSTLVAKAKPKSSPIHNAFEWDDTKAGDEWRLLQARQWIRRVEIIYEDRTEQLIHVPVVRYNEGEPDAYEGREGCYKPISVVAKNVDEFELAIQETLSRLNAAKRAYSSLKAVAPDKATKGIRLPNFKKADRGFEIVEQALTA